MWNGLSEDKTPTVELQQVPPAVERVLRYFKGHRRLDDKQQPTANPGLIGEEAVRRLRAERQAKAKAVEVPKQTNTLLSYWKPAEQAASAAEETEAVPAVADQGDPAPIQEAATAGDYHTPGLALGDGQDKILCPEKIFVSFSKYSR